MPSEIEVSSGRCQRLAQPAKWVLQLGLCCCGVACGGRSGSGNETPDDLATGTSLDGDSDLGSELALAPEQFDAAALAPSAPPDGPDPTGAAWRVIEGPGPQIVRSPSGWLALEWRSLGDGKNPSGWQSALYRSSDGVHWASLPLEPQHDDLSLRRIAYGAGRYMMTGLRYGDRGGEVIWTSTDAEHWTERALPPSGTAQWQELSYAQQRFFIVTFNRLGISETGKDWKTQPFSLIQFGAAAYGNGVYLLTGSGPMWTSGDGWAWREHVLDCALGPSACFGGTDHQGMHPPPFFAEGRFYSGELSSADGENWESSPGRAAAAYVSGHFIADRGRYLEAWVNGGEIQPLRVVRPAFAVTAEDRDRLRVPLPTDEPLPASVDVSFADGLTCETASCFLLGGTLVLVPPPGTPPLAAPNGP